MRCQQVSDNGDEVVSQDQRAQRQCRYGFRFCLMPRARKTENDNRQPHIGLVAAQHHVHHGGHLRRSHPQGQPRNKSHHAHDDRHHKADVDRGQRSPG